uniref:Centromere protein O n=1 Tax=Haplochromis burtoni TaxID=8153 RepID=A0A3Q2W2J8_HAPBU
HKIYHHLWETNYKHIFLGKGACVSIATAYEDVFLDTFNLEIDLKPTVKISRHNIPPFIPLNNLAEQNNMQTDLRVFLDTLSKHLNAFAGRKQQLKLVKEKHKSVEVMESNVLCSLLVLLFTVPREKTAVLCTLDYTDHTRCLPTRVHLESEGRSFTFIFRLLFEYPKLLLLYKYW